MAAFLSFPAGAVADFGNQLPELLTHEDPHFPFKMNLGSDQRALFHIIVTADGRAKNIQILRSTRPDMEEPFVDGLLKWRFRPGMINGEPTEMEVNQPVSLTVFTNAVGVIGMVDAGHSSWDIPPQAPPGLPAEFEYDEAPQPLLTLPAVYPRNMLVQGNKGWATVGFIVDPTGRTRHFVVVDASRPEFGPPAIAMFQSWVFAPARQQGTPCWAAVKIKQKFTLAAEDIQADDNTDHVVRALRDSPCPIIRDPRELDALPVPLYHPNPTLTYEIIRDKVAARAVIEIVVDKLGHAQAARVVSSSRDDFGWAAATAAGRWHFTVPTKGGSPVDAFVTIPFSFSPPQPRAEPAELQIEGADGNWGAYRPYLENLIGNVRTEWAQAVARRADSLHAAGNTVEVNFILNSRGEIARVLSVHPSPGTDPAVIKVCVDSLRAGSPFGVWTDDMVSVLGPSREITIGFTYR